MDARIRKPINVTLDPELIEALDAFLARQPYKTGRSSFIEAAVRRELDRAKAKVNPQPWRGKMPRIAIGVMEWRSVNRGWRLAR